MRASLAVWGLPAGGVGQWRCRPLEVTRRCCCLKFSGVDVVAMIWAEDGDAAGVSPMRASHAVWGLPTGGVGQWRCRPLEVTRRCCCCGFFGVDVVAMVFAVDSDAAGVSPMRAPHSTIESFIMSQRDWPRGVEVLRTIVATSLFELFFVFFFPPPLLGVGSPPVFFFFFFLHPC